MSTPPLLPQRSRPPARARPFAFPSIVAVAIGTVLAPSPSALAAEAGSGLDSTSERFFREETAAGVALVKMAELGVEKAKHEDFKALARLIVADHTRINVELARLAEKKGVELPPDPVARYADLHDKLERTSGAEFDGEFLSMILIVHESCVKNFEEASKTLPDPEVKTWAAKMLPRLQANREKAQGLRSIPAADGGAAVPIAAKDLAASKIEHRTQPHGAPFADLRGLERPSTSSQSMETPWCRWESRS